MYPFYSILMEVHIFTSFSFSQSLDAALQFPLSHIANIPPPPSGTDRYFFMGVGLDNNFRGMRTFFLTFRLCMTFFWWAVACALNHFFQAKHRTWIVKSTCPIVFFFPVALLARFFFSCFGCAGLVFFLKIDQHPSPPPLPRASEKNHGLSLHVSMCKRCMMGHRGHTNNNHDRDYRELIAFITAAHAQ